MSSSSAPISSEKDNAVQACDGAAANREEEASVKRNSNSSNNTKSSSDAKHNRAPPSTKTAAAAAAGTTRRRITAVRPSLSAAAHQRAQLLQLARRSASVAAALLLSQPPPPSPPSPLLLPPAEEPLTSTVMRTAADARSARWKAKRGVSDEPAASTTTGQREAPTSQLRKKQKRLTEKTAASQRAGVDGECGLTAPSESSPLVTAAPCSYAQLWRGLLELQLARDTNGTGHPDNQPDASAVAKTTAAKNNQTRAAKCSPTGTAKGSEKKSEEAAVPTRLVASLSTLADELQVLDDHWRGFLLDRDALSTMHAAPYPLLASVLPADPLFAVAYAPYLSRGEQYTLRRYATNPRASATMLDRTGATVAAPANVEAVPVSSSPSAAPHGCSYSANDESVFCMDHV
ncbi:hypothetical protein ABB37_09032 [Leptomonas pyrrhocoris]|uniref:Uncharacterized protein n=1 Tax=Leptomonas pyrrhocoris TaxID=157538 RepID=A0A0M9FRR1_LEPPY|nr:hypothetical protein ABB37_09032 [Leptomonas pyrrhocoris]XP_015653159.1 hypothetical protein ABB37_09032 [Leptomonas pyrrhocoris]KPA74719.1 hypothetical protein ABB37_09032 [Leptomonas pyrrhocoris]KPA74720.1 hypothetical protein ABB37_09032 [Leptomonas pyrrhocoris]|eukprot:XP_015653158.1 hypothetical protein ABB37_09032 [Leptomonas pyrrhocoris]